MPKKIKKRFKPEIIDLDSRSKVKMSEVLLEYAEPLLKAAEDIQSTRVAITMAAMCWNIALMPEDKQEEIFRDTLAEISKISENYETTKSIMLMLIERKKIFFSEYNKFILNEEVVPLEDGKFYITVAASEFEK